MNWAPWLAKALRALPPCICGACGLPVLTADDEGDGYCSCPSPSVRHYLTGDACPPAPEDDGPSVAWTPAPKDTEFRADGQGGVVIYKRSKTTRRMVPGRRIAPWTEVSP